MPTYQYACRTCDHRFEAVQGFHEEALRVCPECEAEDLRKLFGNVGVVFKGSGFYRNDSRNSTSKTSGSGKVKTDTSTTSGSSGSSSSSTTTSAPAASPSPTAAGSSGA